MNLKNITADKLAALYRNKDLSVTEVIKSTYEEVARVDKSIRAFISLSPDRALEEARRIDAKIAAGEPDHGYSRTIFRHTPQQPWNGCVAPVRL